MKLHINSRLFHCNVRNIRSLFASASPAGQCLVCDWFISDGSLTEHRTTRKTVTMLFVFFKSRDSIVGKILYVVI